MKYVELNASSRRLIKKVEAGNYLLKLVLDRDWEEYIVEVWKGKKHEEKKDYFSGGKDKESKQDAENTMMEMAKQLEKRK